MRRIRGVRQFDHGDCGAACLCSIATAYGCQLPLSRIREMASTERMGTNVMGLVEAAEKMGFMAKGIKGPPGSLVSAPVPSIAHLKTVRNMHHFVVLTRVGKQYAKYMDPEDGSIKKVRSDKLKDQWTGVLVIIAPGPGFEKRKENPGLTGRFISLVRPFRSTLLEAFFGAVLYSLLGLSTSIFIQKIMDFVLLNRNLNLLNLMGTAMIALLIIRNLISWFKSVFLLKAGHQIDAGLLMGYYRHLLSLPQRFFDTMRTGEILSRMNDAVKIRVFINHSLIETMVALLTVILTLLAMALLSRQLCLIVAASLLLFIGVYALLDRINKKVLRSLMEEMAGLETQLVESVRIQRTIRGFGWKSWALGKTTDGLTRVLKESYRSGIASILSSHSGEIISGLLTILILWSGAASVVRGTLSPGELMSFYAMLGYLLGPMRSLGNLNRTFRDALIAADRLFQILDLDQEKNSSSGIRIKRIDRDIEFSRVGFRYGSRPELFRDLSFTIPVGKLTGIAGISGSGKSSIAAMLRAEYLPSEGNLMINNCDIRQIDRASLRKMIGIVPQQIELFSGSILDNIFPGDPKPDQERLFEYAARTGLMRLLKDLPGGLSTEVGEMGLDLSGGERQRIALTRALCQKPDMLILDEPTAALDPASEAEIIKLMEDLRNDSMTLLIISHRLRHIRNSDHIVMIDQGKASETGRHEDLLKTNGPYSRLWFAQQSEC